MKISNFAKIGISFIALSPFNASGAVELPDIISDNAVFQQNSEAKLWGWSKPGAEVTVTPSWDKKEYRIKSDAKTGKWEVRVATPAASFTPYQVTFNDGDGPAQINNVLIGEVWFCTGQSNMEMPLRGFWTQPIEGAAQAIAYSGKYPGIDNWLPSFIPRPYKRDEQRCQSRIYDFYL